MLNIIKVYCKIHNKKDISELDKSKVSNLANVAISQFDEDGDGCLNLEELLKAFRKH